MFRLRQNLLRLCVSVSILLTQDPLLHGQETGRLLLRMETMLKADPGMADSVRKSFSKLIISGRDDPDDSLSAHASLLLAEAYGRAGAFDVEVFFHAYAGSTAWSQVRPSFHLERELRKAMIREQQHKFPGASGRYTDALILAKRAGDSAGMIRATTGLLRVSTRLKDLSNAQALLKDIRPLAMRLDNDRVLADLHQAEGAFHLANGSFTAAMASLELAVRFHETVRDSAAFTEDNIYMARSLRSLSRWTEALSVLNAALVWSVHSTQSRVRVLIELAGLHEALGDARKAMQYLEQADTLSYTSHPELWMEELLPALSTRLARIGEAANLEALLQRYLSVRELVNVKRDDTFLAAGRVISEWERLDTSDAAVRDIKKNRNRIMWVMLAFLLSAIGAVIVIFRQHQRMRTQLRALFRKNLEEMQQAAEASVQQRTLETEPPSNLEEATVQARYQAILQVMERDKPWLDPGFSLQELSTKLATNQKYISQAINMFSETGFSGMMNRYRVNEARRLILEGKPDTSLNDIALQAGFTNRVSFYRQFKDITGISPSEFLKLAR
ncbi:MAG: helix-turn-helix domain-containing protein [Chitinophagaceae bacterium]|nr:helix-turn-helix domain-containing protein [Chitinophagaceae bacterium]